MGREAVEDGDLAGFGRAMVANTDAEASLHPDLVCALAWDVIVVARFERGAWVEGQRRGRRRRVSYRADRPGRHLQGSAARGPG